jgi:ankyrin repeat protein
VNGMDTKITALQLAVCQGKLDVIRLLAQCGANVDTPTDDDDGNKAVHLAALNDQVNVDGNWERICQPRLSRLEQVCNS